MDLDTVKAGQKKGLPRASIIIPAFNARKTIGQCLESALAQSFPRSGYEVIVVDDGSTDTTASIAWSFSGVRVLSQANAGPAKARNAGAKIAGGTILVFLDSDCVPSRDWLEKMLEPFSDPEIAGAQGRYQNPLGSWMPRLVQLEIEERYERMEKKRFIDFIGSYSAAYRSEVFRQAGGFDEKFRAASGEDPDFSYRLADSGHGLVFCPAATVRHFHPVSVWKYWRTKFFRAYWRVRMYRKSPKKIGGDSYTNPYLKFQTGFCLLALLLALLTLVAWLVSMDTALLGMAAGISALFSFLSIVPAGLFIARRDLTAGIASFVVLFVNGFLFAVGMAAGFVLERGK